MINTCSLRGGLSNAAFFLAQQELLGSNCKPASQKSQEENGTLKEVVMEFLLSCQKLPMKAN